MPEWLNIAKPYYKCNVSFFFFLQMNWLFGGTYMKTHHLFYACLSIMTPVSITLILNYSTLVQDVKLKA